MTASSSDGHQAEDCEAEDREGERDERAVGRRVAIQWRGDPGEPWFEGEVKLYAPTGRHGAHPRRLRVHEAVQALPGRPGGRGAVMGGVLY